MPRCQWKRVHSVTQTLPCDAADSQKEVWLITKNPGGSTAHCICQGKQHLAAHQDSDKAGRPNSLSSIKHLCSCSWLSNWFSSCITQIL